jgi:superfamily II DNA or RNA helicase
MRDIINMGYLTDYKIYAPPSDVDLSQVAMSDATGDFNADQLRKAVHKSHITGDIVSHYLKFAPGKLGVTFAVDVEAATEIAAAFRAQGVPAEVVSAKTPDAIRAAISGRFKRREVLQLVNVDLFGEGYDLPAIEVVSFGRPTASFPLYAQQKGRCLRLMLTEAELRGYNNLTDAQRRAVIAASGKPHGIIIDHVGNVFRHGLADAPRVWTLDRRERKSAKKSDAIPMRVCVNTDANGTGLVCAKEYERFHKACPYCGFYPEPPKRSAPEFVDGDLSELDAETLAAMRGEIERVDGDCYPPKGLSDMAKAAIRREHWDRQEAQRNLRNVIAWWAGLQHAQGRSESESYRRFWHTFGVDVASCQALGAREATELAERVNATLSVNGIDGTVNAGAYFSRHN